jgi:hypothetical protein
MQADACQDSVARPDSPNLSAGITSPTLRRSWHACVCAGAISKYWTNDFPSTCFVFNHPISKETSQVASRRGCVARGSFDSVDGMIDNMANTAKIQAGACWCEDELVHN